MFLLTIHVYYLKKEDNGGGRGRGEILKNQSLISLKVQC
jgi:hypothetical protein